MVGGTVDNPRPIATCSYVRSLIESHRVGRSEEEEEEEEAAAASCWFARASNGNLTLKSPN
jgi:hypothetical protein